MVTSVRIINYTTMTIFIDNVTLLGEENHAARKQLDTNYIIRTFDFEIFKLYVLCNRILIYQNVCETSSQLRYFLYIQDISCK